MEPANLKEPTTSTGAQRCQATSKQSGRQCAKPAYPGATVCIVHGAGAPQTKRRARLRLLELVDPAIATLAREMATAEKSADRQRAAENILDRAGYPRSVTTDTDTARALLLEKLLELQAGHQPTADPEPVPQPETVRGELTTPTPSPTEEPHP